MLTGFLHERLPHVRKSPLSEKFEAVLKKKVGDFSDIHRLHQASWCQIAHF
jgi:hypothetical protein